MLCKIISNKQVILECGPEVFGYTWDEIHAKRARVFEELHWTRFGGISATIHMYTRLYENNFCHQKAGANQPYIAKDRKLTRSDLKDFISKTNEEGLPVGIAFNSILRVPEYFKAPELEIIRLLNESGKANGVQNSITIAEHILFEKTRKEFHDLLIIASCISVASERNIGKFSSKKHTDISDAEFLPAYYHWLLEMYDRVVIAPQLLNLSFLENFKDKLDKLVFFLDMPCRANHFGRCAAHYKDNNFIIIPGMPIIPDKYQTSPETSFPEDHSSRKLCHNASYELIRRPKTLKGIFNMAAGQGPLMFKIPERNAAITYVEGIFNRLLQLMSDEKSR